jgi:hypothetical protein
MVDSPGSIVLLGSNRNRVCSMGQGRCRLLQRVSAQIGTLVGKMTFLTTGIALSFSLQWALSSLGTLIILISNSMGMEIVGALNHLMPQGRKSLSSCLRPQLKLLLSRMEHRSN